MLCNLRLSTEANVAIKINHVHNMDCIEGLSQLEAGSVDLAFADPPFNIGYDYDVYKDRKAAEEYLDWSRKWMAGVVRALKPTGTFWLAIGDEYAAELKLIATRDLNLTCRNWVVWYYTFGVHCKAKFTRSHAHLFYFVKDAKEFTFNDAAVRVPSARQLVYADKRADPKGRLPDDTWILRPQDLPEGFKADEDTWYFPRVCGTFKERAGWHGCQMPEQLLGRIIRGCSNEDDLVLDPFGGSGTTLAVAKKLGRRWIGFELSKEYAKQIERRLEQAEVDDPLDGTENPLTSAPQTPRSLSSLLPIRKPKPVTNLLIGVGQDHINNARPQRDLGDISRAILEAYRVSCQGFSRDRVIADPSLNEAFLDQCKRLGIPGTPVELNLRLHRIGKRGQLGGIMKRRRIISHMDMDPYLFASEIAWRILEEQNNLSLDSILCSPRHAQEFDRIARCFAPGYTSFQYRWAALALRKDANKKVKYALMLNPAIASRQFGRKAYSLDEARSIEPDQGLYLIRSSSSNIYVGETYDLQQRLTIVAAHAKAMELLSLNAALLSVKILYLQGARLQERLGLHSRLLGSLRPRANANLDKQAYAA